MIDFEFVSILIPILSEIVNSKRSNNKSNFYASLLILRLLLAAPETRRDRRGERSHRIRLYSASELAMRLRDVGLVVEQAFDSWSTRPLGRTSSEMLLVARKDG